MCSVFNPQGAVNNHKALAEQCKAENGKVLKSYLNLLPEVPETGCYVCIYFIQWSMIFA